MSRVQTLMTTMNLSLYCTMFSIFQSRNLRVFLYWWLLAGVTPPSLSPGWWCQQALTKECDGLGSVSDGEKRETWAALASRGLPGVGALVTKQNREDHNKSRWTISHNPHSDASCIADATYPCIIIPDPLIEIETRKIILFMWWLSPSPGRAWDHLQKLGIVRSGIIDGEEDDELGFQSTPASCPVNTSALWESSGVGVASDLSWDAVLFLLITAIRARWLCTH